MTENLPVRDFAKIAVGFSRLLRSAGLTVPVDRVFNFENALGLIGVSSRRDVRNVGRSTLVSRPEDFEIYDSCFSAWWLGVTHHGQGIIEDDFKIAIETDMDDQEETSSDEELLDAFDPDVTIQLKFSSEEILRDKDFAKCSPEEINEAARAIEKIAMVVPRRVSNRRTHSRSSSGPLDMARTVRRAMANQGEPIRIMRKEKSSRPRRVVLLCDISGSMEPYARAMIRFLHSAVVGGIRVEAFTFGTHLTRITKELNWKDPDIALSRASSAVTDWSGGTRIGESIRYFNNQFGVRGMARRATIVIMSDGWDRGDPGLLSQEMARLSRVAYQVVWVNPLKYTPGFAPIARGMAAAIPYIDAFIEGHSLGSLERLAEVISN